MPHFDPEDEANAPTAESVGWYLCSDCDGLHVHLRDDDDALIGSAVFTRAMILAMLADIDGSLGEPSTTQ